MEPWFIVMLIGRAALITQIGWLGWRVRRHKLAYVPLVALGWALYAGWSYAAVSGETATSVWNCVPIWGFVLIFSVVLNIMEDFLDLKKRLNR